MTTARRPREKLTPTDKALKLAIVLAPKGDRASQQQIDAMLKERPWREVAMFEAYGCQCDALRLKPWQLPPCWAEVDDQDNQAGLIPGHRAAAELRRR